MTADYIFTGMSAFAKVDVLVGSCILLLNTTKRIPIGPGSASTALTWESFQFVKRVRMSDDHVLPCVSPKEERSAGSRDI